MTFETVTSALEEAERVHAIDPVLFRVRASAHLAGLRARLFWSETSSERVLMLRVLSPDPEVASALALRSIAWQPDQPAPAVGDAVVLVLEQLGLPSDPETFDWGRTIESLQASLAVAIAARRRDPGAPRLQGRLIELVNDEWMLTDAGIECPGRAFILDEGSFPKRPKLPRRPGQISTSTFEPDRPTWVSADFWENVVRLGQLIYPIEPRTVMQDLGWPGRRRRWGDAGVQEPEAGGSTQP